MAALVCDICGGKLVIGAGGIAVCQSCGMEYTSERIKEKMQVGTVVVSEPVSDVDKLRQLLREAYDNANYEEAYDHSIKILETNPDDWEATYLKGFSKGWQSSLADIYYSAVMGGLHDADIKLYKDKSLTDEEKAQNLGMMIIECIDWFYTISNALIKHANEFAYDDSDVACMFFDEHGALIREADVLMTYFDEFLFVNHPKEKEIRDIIEYYTEYCKAILDNMNLSYTAYSGEKYSALADMWFDDYREYTGKGFYTEEKKQLKSDLKQLNNNVIIWSNRRKEFKEEQKRKQIENFIKNHPEYSTEYYSLKNSIEILKEQIKDTTADIQKKEKEEESLSKEKADIQKMADDLNNEINKLKNKWFGRDAALLKAGEKKQELYATLESLRQAHDKLTRIEEEKSNAEEKRKAFEAKYKQAEKELNSFLRLHKLL